MHKVTDIEVKDGWGSDGNTSPGATGATIRIEVIEGDTVLLTCLQCIAAESGA